VPSAAAALSPRGLPSSIACAPIRDARSSSRGSADGDGVHVLRPTKTFEHVVKHRVPQGRPIGVAQMNGQTALRYGQGLVGKTANRIAERPVVEAQRCRRSARTSTR
jgi:hypothetical protein